MKPTHSLRRLLAGSSLAFVCVSFASAADYTWDTGVNASWFSSNWNTSQLWVGGSGNNAIVNTGTVTVPSGNDNGSVTANSITINNGGTVNVGSTNAFNGTVNSITINAGGTLTSSNDASNHLNLIYLNGGTITGSDSGNVYAGGWGVFNLDNTITVDGGANTSTISVTGGGVTLGQTGGTVFDVKNGSAAVDLLVSGNIVKAPNTAADTGLIKSGAGTMVLSGSNTYQSGTKVNAGTLSVSAIADSGTSNIGTSGTLTFGGGTLQFTGTSGTTGRALTFTGTGSIEVASGSTLTLTGGQWTGNGGFTKTGEGAMVVGANASDRFTIDSSHGGAFTMSTGTVTVANTSYFVMGDDGGIATLNQTGGMFNVNVSEGFYVGNGANSASTMNITGGSLNFTGNHMRLGQASGSVGTLNIGGGAGLATVTLPRINFSENSGSAQGFLNLNSNGVLNIAKITQGAGQGTVTFNGGTLQASANEVAFMEGIYAATISSGGAMIDSNGFNITIGQAINGSGGLSKSGTGTLTLSGANSYSGGTTVNTGVLSVGAIADSGTSHIGNSGSLAFGGGTLAFTGTTGSTARALAFTGSGGIKVATGSTLTLTGGQWTGNGGFTKTGDGAMVVGSNLPSNDRFEIDSTRGGVFNMNAGSFTISSGTTYFVMGDDGQNATFNMSGGTFTNNAGGGVYLANGGGASTMNITGGTFSSNGGPMRLGQGAGATGILNIGGGAGLASVTLPSIVSSEVASNATAAINLNSNGLLNVSKITKHTGAISVIFDGGTLQASANESAFMEGLDSATINTGGATIDSQAFAITVGQGMGGTGGLTKSGSGTLTLSGANSYNGITTVNQGRLVVSGAISNSAVTVNNAATVLASGATGTLGKSVTVNNGAILAAGGSGSIGTAAIGSDGLTMNTGSIFEWDLQAASTTDPGVVADGATGTYDKIVANGAATGGSAVFKIVLGGNAFTDAFWDTDKSWTDIFTGSGAPALLSGLFNAFDASGGLASDGTVAGQGQFTFNGSTATLNWTAVPESTSALVGLLIGAGLLRRRRL